MVKPLYPHAHPYVLCVGYNNPLNMFTWKCPRQNVCHFVQASMYSDCTTQTAQLKILVFLTPLFTNRNWLIQHRDSVMDMWPHPRKGWNAITHPCLNFNTDLTHLPLDKMAAISQTIYSDAFSRMKSFIFWLKFHWSLFLRVQMTITKHWFR